MRYVQEGEVITLDDDFPFPPNPDPENPKKDLGPKYFRQLGGGVAEPQDSKDAAILKEIENLRTENKVSKKVLEGLFADKEVTDPAEKLAVLEDFIATGK